MSKIFLLIAVCAENPVDNVDNIVYNL